MKAAARPICFVVSSLAPRRTSSVLSRGSLRAFAQLGLLATLSIATVTVSPPTVG